MDAALDQLPDDPVLLKAMIVEERVARTQMAASVRAYEALVQALKVRIARLRRQKFGASSEKIEREIEQFELALEALEVKRAADDPSPDPQPRPPAPTPRATPRMRAHATMQMGRTLRPPGRRPAGAASRGSQGMRHANASCSTPARPAPNAAASCGCWGRTSRRSWSSLPPG